MYQKFFGFLVLFLFLIVVFYTLIKHTNQEPFSVFLLFPICLILFLFSLYFYLKQNQRAKKQMLCFALIMILIISPFIGVKFYNYAIKEPSYLIGEIILAKKMSKSDGDITKYINSQILNTIKSQNLEYLKSQGFSVNLQNEQINAFFKGVVKRQNLKISIIIKNDEVKVIAFSGYNAL